MRITNWAALLLAAVGSSAVAVSPEPPVQVMVVGTFHFDSPGLDLNNANVDDVLKPTRQEELRRLVAALAEFEPTKIMVERVPTSNDQLDPIYTNFTPKDLDSNRDERFQIAYRLAFRLKHAAVYAIDEQPSEGEPDYFPAQPVFDWAKGNGAESQLNALMGQGAAMTADLEAALTTQTIPQVLATRNTRNWDAAEQRMYYAFLGFGGIDQQPGADLNAMWYLRNAKIFGKLQKAVVPGDRVLVVYGSGHNYWLRHFVENTPGFQPVDPLPYLEKAAQAAAR